MTTLDCSLLQRQFSTDYWMTLDDFSSFLTSNETVSISKSLKEKLTDTRGFIDYLLSMQIRVYGLTTGFADLRNTAVNSEYAALLSKNMILSHDAGIGKPLEQDITLGAMLLRAHSLSKGYSGFSSESLETLLQMINFRIVPEVPCTGSLGASGDLAFLARLGRAMMGEEVPVWCQGNRMSAKKALRLAKIDPMIPKAKEGLALTNGTSFMASMLAIAYKREILCLENMFSLLGLFLNAVSAAQPAYFHMMQIVRHQSGQILVADILRLFLQEEETREIQNDYSIRCLPQILGPKVELILQQREKIEKELNAITDNPLIFRDDEISQDVDPSHIIPFKNSSWVVASGGNFHGEASGTAADIFAIANAKIALTLERQLTFMLNPFRNEKKFPIYLVGNPKLAGFQSGYMISQYTGNALTHKISLLSHPATTTNLTSANESEDVVSYGATAAQKLLEQIDLLEQLLAIHLLTVSQAYSLVRKRKESRNPLCEEIFEKICSKIPFPQTEDESFDHKYQEALLLLRSGELNYEYLNRTKHD